MFPSVNVDRVCRVPSCMECTGRTDRGQKKPRRLGGASGAGTDAKTQGRGSRLWRLREVSSPRMPLRASVELVRDLRRKLHDSQRNLKTIHSHGKLTTKSLLRRGYSRLAFNAPRPSS